jgi:hypothetical protein
LAAGDVEFVLSRDALDVDMEIRLAALERAAEASNQTRWDQMKNVRRRLHRLEQLAQFQPPPSPLDLIRGRPLESLSTQELGVLWFLLSIRNEDAGELSEDEAGACAAWQASVEAEALRMGFTSFAEADPVSRAICAMSNLFTRLEKIDLRCTNTSGPLAKSEKSFASWQRILARWVEKENMTFPDRITRAALNRMIEQGDREDDPLR